MVFGHFGDRVGRKKMLVVSLMMMGVATFAIGLLPTYATIGVAAPILLLVCRLFQGFAVGGEWGGAVLMVAEHGDEKSRGFWSSWPQAGVPLGNMLATGVLFVLAAVQSDADFEAWGWRIPFLLSAVLVLIGLFVRLSLEESPVFQEAKAEIAEKQQTDSHLPILEVIRTYPKEVLIAMGMRMAENISYYIFTIIVDHLRHDYLGADTDMILKMLLIGAGMQFVLIPAHRCAVGPGRSTAALPRRRRRRRRVGFVFFGLIETRPPAACCSRWPGRLLFHSLMYAPQAAFFSELFGTSVRYTGASVGYQLASIFAGALAPDHRHASARPTVQGRTPTASGSTSSVASGAHDRRGAVRQGDQGELAAPRPRRARRPRLTHGHRPAARPGITPGRAADRARGRRSPGRPQPPARPARAPARRTGRRRSRPRSHRPR